jgi:hypothetical protein
MIKQPLYEYRNVLCGKELEWIQPALSEHGMRAACKFRMAQVFIKVTFGGWRLVDVFRSPSRFLCFGFPIGNNHPVSASRGRVSAGFAIFATPFFHPLAPNLPIVLSRYVCTFD